MSAVREYGLSEASLKAMADRFEALASGMDAVCQTVADDLAGMAVETARAAASSQGVGGIEILASSLGGGAAEAAAVGEKAAFVEFGTGVVGRGTYPDGDPWPYDTRRTPEAHDPADPERWYYYDESGRRHSTKGMAARPFMLPAAQAARAGAADAVRRALR